MATLRALSYCTPRLIPVATRKPQAQLPVARRARRVEHRGRRVAKAVPTEEAGVKLEAVSLEFNLIEHHEIDSFDLIIAGAGPSGLTVGSRVAKSGFRVCIVDPYPHSVWPNNYGVWVDEFEAMGLEDCLHTVWPKAEVFLENDAPAKVLNRPYARVDRPKLKRRLLDACRAAGVYFHQAKVEGVDTSVEKRVVACSDGKRLEARLVLDATGHSRKLIHYDQEFDPGFQGAYGYMATVKSHPFDQDAMLFLDWRDTYAQDDAALMKRVSELPTFLYAMPFSDTEIFLEETSLVAKPIAPFDELKERLEKRLQYLGIEVLDKREEEYCVIPMGGVLPQNPQTILGIGGTAGMVHPSTGYMISRMLGAAPGLADSIIDQLAEKSTWDASEAQEASEMLWKGLWPVERIRQRDFHRFGMEVLLRLNLQETRDFFSAFFSLSDRNWQGFLSSRLSLFELVAFGWSLFLSANNDARRTILQKGAPFLLVLISSVAPTYFRSEES